RECPEVVANLEDFDVDVTYTNDSSNNDESVTLVEFLPEDAVYKGVTWFLGGQTGTVVGENAFFDYDETDNTLTWLVTNQLAGPLTSLQSARMLVHLEVDGVDSGTFISVSGLGTASNGSVTVPVSIFSSCDV